MVKIVGAGPGAKDLITVRGMRMLNEADRKSTRLNSSHT